MRRDLIPNYEKVLAEALWITALDKVQQEQVLAVMEAMPAHVWERYRRGIRLIRIVKAVALAMVIAFSTLLLYQVYEAWRQQP
jgi:hypothetical protein